MPTPNFVDNTTVVTAAWLNSVNITLDPVNYGAIGDGITDDTVAIQAAIDDAEAIGASVDGKHRFYAISYQLTVGGGRAISMKNFNLVAITGVWPTGSSGAMLKVTAPTNHENTNHEFSNINCNASSVAKTGWYVYRVQAKASFIDCHTWFFSEYGFWIQGTGNGNNDTRYIGCTAAERLWTADAGDAFNDLAQRTAIAWFVDYSADVEFVDCVGYGSLRNLKVANAGGYSLFTGCKYWAGPTRTEAASVTVELDTAVSCSFTGCRFDDGAVLITDGFQGHKFTGCRFIQFNANNVVRFLTSTASNTAAGTSFIGNSFHSGNTVGLETTGSGTWASDLNVIWVGNAKGNDGSAATVNTWEMAHGRFKFKNGTYVFGDGVGAELMYVNGAAGSNRLYAAQTNGVLRWSFGAGGANETGSDAGSNFAVNAYSDAGAYLFTPFSITRATGESIFTKTVARSGDAGSNRLFEAQTAGSTRWAFGATDESEAGSDVGSNFVLFSYDDSGTYKTTPMKINRVSSIATFVNNIVITPPAMAEPLAINGQVTFEATSDTSFTIFHKGSDGTIRSVVLTLT
jgi:hypothetical protein